MKRYTLPVVLIVFFMSGFLAADERLLFISEADMVPNLYMYDPEANSFDTITSYPINGVAGYDITPDGRLLATAVMNPVAEQYLGLKLVTRAYPYDYEKIVMTFVVDGWDAVRDQYKVAIDPSGKYVACVDTMGTMLINLDEETIKYIFTHGEQPDRGVCESYYNWGGEFSPDGNSFCLQSYCVANRLRFDVYTIDSVTYRNIYELNNITGFSWLAGSDGLLLSANSCGESAGLYIADLSPSIPLINLEVCNLARAKCNIYFEELYSEFMFPQVLGEEKFMVYARGVKYDGTVLNDLFIVDQESQLIREMVQQQYIEVLMSASGRYLAGVINPNPLAKNGRLFIYDNETSLSTNIWEQDSTCSQIQWIDLE